MFKFVIAFCVVIHCLGCNDPSQQTIPAKPYQNAWVNSPTSEWPQIAMINEVWYQDSQRYIHPSFEYAGTGFLIDTGSDTLAATAKHVLWIAKHKKMRSVNPNPFLEKWMMHPKGNLADSVVIDALINTDTLEFLQGRGSSIQERDWIVFTTKQVSPNIFPLRPSFRQLQPGERIYYTGCPYNDSTCVTETALVLSSHGNRIVFSQEDTTANAGGASGSPLIDTAGYLVGIFCGSSVDPRNGGPAFYGLGTHYLQKVLTGDPDKNQPLVSIGDHLREEIMTHGFDTALSNCKALAYDPQAYFTYRFSPEEMINAAAERLDSGYTQQAIDVIKLALDVHPNFSRSMSFLGTAYTKAGRQDSARAAYREALRLWPGNEEAKGGLSFLNR